MDNSGTKSFQWLLCLNKHRKPINISIKPKAFLMTAVPGQGA